MSQCSLCGNLSLAMMIHQHSDLFCIYSAVLSHRIRKSWPQCMPIQCGLFCIACFHFHLSLTSMRMHCWSGDGDPFWCTAG
jgi:hypothetical protein